MPQLATEASHPSSLKMLWGIIRNYENYDNFRIFLWIDSLKSCRTDRDGKDLLSQLMMQRTRPRGIVTTGLRITSSNKFGSCHVMLRRILQSFLTLYQDSNLYHWRCEIARSPPKSQATLWFCKKKSTSNDEMLLQKALTIMRCSPWPRTRVPDNPSWLERNFLRGKCKAQTLVRTGVNTAHWTGKRTGKGAKKGQHMVYYYFTSGPPPSSCKKKPYLFTFIVPFLSKAFMFQKWISKIGTKYHLWYLGSHHPGVREAVESERLAIGREVRGNLCQCLWHLIQVILEERCILEKRWGRRRVLPIHLAP